MSEADKMFLVIGYKKREKEDNKIIYMNMVFSTFIEFDLKNKYIRVMTENNAVSVAPGPIFVDELKAINKKVEELGWND